MIAPLPDYSPEDMVNRPPLPGEWRRCLVRGFEAIAAFLAEKAAAEGSRKRRRAFRLGLDGHLGVNWAPLLEALKSAFDKRGLKPRFLDIAACARSPRAIEKLVAPCLPEDPIFGRVYGGRLADFFDSRKIAALRKTLQEGAASEVLVCFGQGAALTPLRSLHDLVVYLDLTREEIFKRVKLGLVRPLGEPTLQGKTAPAQSARKQAASAAELPAYFGTRRFYYVDHAVLDRHRKRLLPRVDCYVDGSTLEEPKLIPGEVLHSLLDLLARGPVKAKPGYDPSPWGGTWMKRVRRLPREMVNCAWSYDLIEPEASFVVDFGGCRLEFPFPILTGLRPKATMGSKALRPRFRGQLPVRLSYDDSFQGGHMALQSHPNDAYIRSRFNEPYRQDESYYVVDCGPGAKTHLGLTEEASVSEFRQAVLRAEKHHLPFDHDRFVNSFPSRIGDLFLIPAGTLHGSGANQVVLEIGATTYRYTFHFYDFLRPGLDGKLRAIHADHSFKSLKTYRRSRWAAANLKQPPRLLRRSRGEAEYLLGARRDMFFRIHRLEFASSISDDTKGQFHLLVVVAGNGVRICPQRRPELATQLPFSCGALVPAAVGPYQLQSTDGKPRQVVKVLLR